MIMEISSAIGNAQISNRQQCNQLSCDRDKHTVDCFAERLENAAAGDAESCEDKA